jgi:hypothetical protein
VERDVKQIYSFIIGKVGGGVGGGCPTYQWYCTFNNDNSRVIKFMEHLIEGPSIMATQFVVSLELLLWPGQAYITDIWMLQNTNKMICHVIFTNSQELLTRHCSVSD